MTGIVSMTRSSRVVLLNKSQKLLLFTGVMGMVKKTLFFFSTANSFFFFSQSMDVKLLNAEILSVV